MLLLTEGWLHHTRLYLCSSSFLKKSNRPYKFTKCKNRCDTFTRTDELKHEKRL